VAAVQYTFTHKQYTEYRERNMHNNKKKNNWEVWAVPRLRELYRDIEKCPDIPVAAVQYTFIHKQYTEYRERNMCDNKKKNK
jgi:hypothetical protein